MDELQALAPETATDVPVTQEIGNDSGAPETVAETDEQKEVNRLAEERKVGERAKRNIQKRFNEMTAEKRQLMDVIQRLTAGRQDATPAPAPEPKGAPRRENFDTYEEYLRADARYQAREEFRQAQEQWQNQTREADQRRQLETVQQHYARSIQEFAEKTPDFAEVVERDDIQVPDALVKLLPFVPNAPQVLYAIGKNPALAAELNRYGANPAALLFMCGQVTSSVPPAQSTKAPPPGKPVGSRGGSVEKDSRHMSADEYYASITEHHRGKK